LAIVDAAVFFIVRGHRAGNWVDYCVLTKKSGIKNKKQDYFQFPKDGSHFTNVRYRIKI